MLMHEMGGGGVAGNDRPDPLAGHRSSRHHHRVPRRLKSQGREAFEDAGLPVQLVPVQIVPDVIGFDTIVRQMPGKTVQVEGLRYTIVSVLPSHVQAALLSRSPVR